MIGQELADRVSPVSMLRPELLVDDGTNDCWACGAAHTACRHSDFSPGALEDHLVAAPQGQPAGKRGPGRPPKSPTVADTPPVVTPAAPAADVVAEEVVDGKVVEAAVTPAAEPAIAPAGPAPTETVTQPSVAPQAGAAAPVVAVEPPMVKPPGPMPLGSDYGSPGVQSISPIAPDAVPRVSAVSVGAHAQGEGGVSVYDVPLGMMDPADDEFRPDCVLVSDESQVAATGAWALMPGGLQVCTTSEIQLVFWQAGLKRPLYRMLSPMGAVLPRPPGI